MADKEKFSYINIREYLGHSAESGIGESELEEILSDFSCQKNPDVERFLKKNAIEFAKKNQSVTYLVFSNVDGELLGYFTIALKPLTVQGEKISKTVKRKLQRVSELDEQSQSYTMAAYLIAQLGKNFSNGANERITGTELLGQAWNVLEEMQYAGGGMVVFLEANNDNRLLEFYEKNGFKKFAARQKRSDMHDDTELVQMLKLL